MITDVTLAMPNTFSLSVKQEEWWCQREWAPGICLRADAERCESAREWDETTVRGSGREDGEDVEGGRWDVISVDDKLSVFFPKSVCGRGSKRGNRGGSGGSERERRTTAWIGPFGSGESEGGTSDVRGRRRQWR